MKNGLLLTALLLSATLGAQVATHKENIERTLRFSRASADNLLIVQNISGTIQVEGSDRSDLVVTVVKTIKAKHDDNLAAGKEEIDLGVVEKEDVILLYMEHPCMQNLAGTMTAEQLRNEGGWNRWGDCRWNPRYDYQLDYTLRVPRGVHLRLSTVNNGDIEVRNVDGDLKVNNVNGPIALSGVAGAVDAHTVNGDVTVRYRRNPRAASKYYTLNGDINAYFTKDLQADVFFESFNGDLYTDFREAEMLPPALEKKRVENEQGISYKVGGKSGLRIGGGGVRLDVETFNGDAYLREE